MAPLCIITLHDASKLTAIGVPRSDIVINTVQMPLVTVATAKYAEIVHPNYAHCTGLVLTDRRTRSSTKTVGNDVWC